MPNTLSLGIDASGARCGLAIVADCLIGPRLIWQTTVHTPKSENVYDGASKMRSEIVKSIEAVRAEFGKAYDFSGLITSIEDPSAFAYATALHHTSKTTNPAAVFGFPWTLAIVMLAIYDVFGYAGITQVYSFQPSQWQSKLGVKKALFVGAIKEALEKTFQEEHPERNKKGTVRGIVSQILSAPSLIEYRLLRSGRYDWVIEQDGVDAAGIAYVGLREHLFGAPAGAKKKQIQTLKK